MNFDNSIIRLYFYPISIMLTKFPKNQKSITMSSIKCLNFKFFVVKLLNYVQKK